MKTGQSSFTYLLNDLIHIGKHAKVFFAVLSPFMLLAGILFFAFPYILITGESSIKSTWLQVILFPEIIADLILAHIILCKYFRINPLVCWLIELSLSVFVIYLLA
jgi:hypothetical protein